MGSPKGRKNRCLKERDGAAQSVRFSSLWKSSIGEFHIGGNRNKPINQQDSSLRLNGKIPFRQKSSCGQLKASFRGEQGIYPSYLSTVVWNTSKFKVFSPLIVRIDAAFSGHCLFSVCGGLSPHRACSIWPGWSRGETAACKLRSVSIRPEIGARFPTACPVARQRGGTICREANRIYSEHRHIPPRHPMRYSYRYHSCSTHAPASASVGIVDNS